ncbi:MAG TPA: bifunctional diguanylate cyclase/phosphodiesterase [Allosphingosinicella sp.]|nr:bifunctional diguanylate cyclase/phosphodiesterase [Allosphingosinicella sp.]
MAKDATGLREQVGVTATRRFIVPVAGLMLVVGAMMIAVILYSARTMDENIVSAQTELIDNSINARLTRSLSEVRSVAWWDEAVVKSRGTTFDADWLDLEVGAFMTESFQHNRIMILDEANRPVYGYNSDGRVDSANLSGDLAAVSSLVAQVRGGRNVSPRITDAAYAEGATEGTTERRYGRSAAAVVRINGHGELASVMTITPSVEMSLQRPRPRILVSFIRLDDAYWRAAGRDMLLPDLGFAAPGGERRGSFALRTDGGQPLGTLSWTPRRPGLLLMGNVLPLVLVGLALSILVVSALARRLFSASRALEAREAAAQHLANHDALTGLPNRRLLESEFAVFAARAEREGARLAIACVDVDRFKDINDTLGHHAGDQLVCGLAERLGAAMRDGDFVARLGGDEFAVLRVCRDEADADALLDALRGCFASPFPITGHLVEANASAGLAFAETGRSFEDLMREADIALYEAKACGRGCDVRFEASMGRKIETRRMIEIDLRKAIAQGELSVLYQPIVEASTGQISSVEALCRWTSARHGPIPPDVFIPIAEEAGLMAELGRYVIERAIKDSLKWPQLDTAINVSAAQLRSVSILEDLIRPAERYGVSPERITIEITESVLLSNDGHTTRMLQTLKECGFALALDDFGTGYSSLAYIRDFPFDRLKIDRSFVHGLKNSERALAIIEAVANFGRILGKHVVAEGIETEQEMQAMQRAGCTHLQGWLFAKALPAEKIEAMVALGRLAAARKSGGEAGADAKVERRAYPRRGRGRLKRA